MEEDVFTRKVKQRWRKRQRERQKSNRLRLAKQQLCTCITLFRTFLCRHYTTSTWKCLISRFVETKSTKQRLSICFFELRYRLLEFNSRKKCQHVKNWTRWNKRDKVWIGGNSLLKWPSLCCRRRCCLSSLLILGILCEGYQGAQSTVGEYWIGQSQQT